MATGNDTKTAVKEFKSLMENVIKLGELDSSKNSPENINIKIKSDQEIEDQPVSFFVKEESGEQKLNLIDNEKEKEKEKQSVLDKINEIDRKYRALFYMEWIDEKHGSVTDKNNAELNKTTREAIDRGIKVLQEQKKRTSSGNKRRRTTRRRRVIRASENSRRCYSEL